MKAGASTSGKKMFRRRDAHKNAPAMEWLSDLSGKTARLTSIGGRSLLVENHCGILEFSSERIVLATRCGPVQGEGAVLFLEEVRSDTLLIRGSIRNVQLPCREADSHEP